MIARPQERKKLENVKRPGLPPFKLGGGDTSLMLHRRRKGKKRGGQAF